jgi:hypothetical protein
MTLPYIYTEVHTEHIPLPLLSHAKLVGIDVTHDMAVCLGQLVTALHQTRGVMTTDTYTLLVSNVKVLLDWRTSDGGAMTV